MCPVAKPEEYQSFLDLAAAASNNIASDSGAGGAGGQSPQKAKPPPLSRFTLSLNASRAWIKHFRGAAFEDVDALPRERLLCGGVDDICGQMGEQKLAKVLSALGVSSIGGDVSAPAALQCRSRWPQQGRTQADLSVNPVNAWVEERVFLDAARGLGGVLSGAYEARKVDGSDGLPGGRR